MQLSRAMMIVLLVSTTAMAQRANTACEWLTVASDRLTLATSGGSRELLADVRGIQLPRWSSDHTLIAYARDFRFENGDARSQIVIVDRNGARVKEIPVTEEHGINAVMNLGWLGNDRVWTEGHATPSTSIYHEWNLKSGRSDREVWGSWFAPSPDGKSLAYVAFVPHGAPPPHNASRVMIGDVQVYPPRDDTTQHIVKQLTWTGDALVFADQTTRGIALTTINASTHAVSASVPLSAMPEAITPGASAGTVDLVIDGQTMRANLSDGTLTPMRRTPRTAADSICQ